MSAPGHFITGDRIYLREVRESDVTDRYYRWMNDPEVTRYLESRFFPNSPETLREYVASRRGDRAQVFLAIALIGSDLHIGNIKLGPVDWIHRTAEVGLLIGDRDYWGQGYATEAIRLAARYAFDTLDLRKLTAGAYDVNVGSIRAFEKAGFEREGLRRAQYFCEGRFVDLVLLGLLRDR